jgi:hypothetical protein
MKTDVVVVFNEGTKYGEKWGGKERLTKLMFIYMLPNKLGIHIHIPRTIVYCSRITASSVFSPVACSFLKNSGLLF